MTDAFCGLHGYSEQIENPSFDSDKKESEENQRMIENPEKRADFAKRIVREWIILQVSQWEKMQAIRTMEKNISESISSISIS